MMALSHKVDASALLGKERELPVPREPYVAPPLPPMKRKREVVASTSTPQSFTLKELQNNPQQDPDIVTESEVSKEDSQSDVESSHEGNRGAKNRGLLGSPKRSYRGITL